MRASKRSIGRWVLAAALLTPATSRAQAVEQRGAARRSRLPAEMSCSSSTARGPGFDRRSSHSWRERFAGRARPSRGSRSRPDFVERGPSRDRGGVDVRSRRLAFCDAAAAFARRIAVRAQAQTPPIGRRSRASTAQPRGPRRRRATARALEANHPEQRKRYGAISRCGGAYTEERARLRELSTVPADAAGRESARAAGFRALERASGVPPPRARRLLSPLPGLAPERRARTLERLHRFQSLSPAERERLLENWKRWQQMLPRRAQSAARALARHASRRAPRGVAAPAPQPHTDSVESAERRD